jgi:hypothetical protein
MTLVRIRNPTRSQTEIEPPIQLCTDDYRHQHWLNKEKAYRLGNFCRVTISAVLLSFVVIKPLNSAKDWAWQALNLLTFDKSSLEENFKPLATDKDFNSTMKLGDRVLEWEVTSVFGKREKPCPSCSSDHKGVDIWMPIGTPLYAIGEEKSTSSFHDGYVDVACPFNPLNPPEGIAAYIQSPLLPDTEIALFHLSECYSGRHPVGAMIAKSGNSGASTGAHLHYGVKVKGEWIDPPRGYLMWILQGKKPQSTKPIVERLRNAIAAQESNHNPSAINPHSNALGYGQVMPENIKEWSTQCLGKPLTESEFIKSKEKQIKIIDCKLTEYLAESKDKPLDLQVRYVASKWYSGDGNLFDNPRPQTYGAGDYPSIKNYTETVLERFKKQ